MINSGKDEATRPLFSPHPHSAFRVKKVQTIELPLSASSSTDDLSFLPATDTSWQAWLMVISGLLIYSSFLSVFYSFGIYLIPLTQEFNVGKADVSWVASMHYLFGYGSSVFVGKFSETYGPRITTMTGGVLIAGGTLIASYTTVFPLLHIGFGVLAGFGGSCAIIPCISCVVTWFEKHRGLATGIVASGSGVGNFIGPMIGQLLMDKYGWRAAMRYVGVGAGVVVFVSGSFLRFRIQYSDVNHEKPRVPPMPLRVALRKAYFQAILVFCFLGALSFNVPIYHIPAFAEFQGVADDKAALLLSLMGAGQIIGRIVHGWYADKYGPTICMFIAITFMGVSSLLWPIFMTTFQLLLIYVLIYGFNVGAIYALPPAVIGGYFKGVNPAKLIGMYFTTGSMCTVAGPVITGFIFDVTGTYSWPVGLQVGIPLLLSLLPLAFMLVIERKENVTRLKKQDKQNLWETGSYSVH